MSERWTINELTALAAAALTDSTYNGQASGRVRDVPDKRTIRYYTTLGLLDRPAEMRGRTAWYGRRHVLQLAAIKRLQAQGLTLLDVQKRLAGAEDRTLADLARLPEGFWERLETNQPASASAPDATTARPRFWATAPSVPQPLDGTAPAMSARPALQLRLAPGVTLVLDGVDAESLRGRELATLSPAVRTLLDSLSDLELLPSQEARL